MTRKSSPRGARRAAVATAIAVGAMLIAACSSGGGSSATSSSTTGASGQLSIRIPLTSDLSAVPELVAIQQGFFAKNGLNVIPSEVSDTTTLPQLAGHTFDVVCIVPTQFISAISSGIDLTAVSTETVDTDQNQSAGILVSKDSGIKSMMQLQGKTIGTPSVTGTMILGVRKLIKEGGGNPDSINPVQAPASQLGDLLSAGKFQAITALQPVLTSLVSKGFVDLGDPFRAVDKLAANGMCAAPTSYVQAHPKLPAEYQAAIQEAGAWVQKNPDAAMKLYEDKSGTSAATLKGVKLPQIQGTLLTSDLNSWQDLMLQMGTLKQKIDLAAHIPS